MTYLAEYGLFLAKIATIVVAIICVLMTFVAVAIRNRQPSGEQIDIKKINDRYRDMAEAVEMSTLSPTHAKKKQKEQKKQRKAESKAQKKDNTVAKKRVFVLNFDGDIRASEVMLLREEITAILLGSREGDEVAKKILIECNLRFVISVAKNYQGQGIDLPDLIAEGNYGLLKAIKSFDWKKGYRFISYAVWWVKQSILQCLNENARTIRLPVNIVQELQKQKKKIGKEITELDSKLAQLPTTINYDKPINEEGDTLIQILQDGDALMPDHLFDDECNIKTELNRIMSCLDAREKEIIERYYGLGYTPHTLQEIGDIFRLTKERVRQIKEKALRKLRNDSYSLLEYLTN